MEHIFLTSRDHLTIEQAMRRAELLALGASDAIHIIVVPSGRSRSDEHDEKTLRGFAFGVATIALISLAQPMGAQRGAASPPVVDSGCAPNAHDLHEAAIAARKANPSDTSAFLKALDAFVGVRFGIASSAAGAYEVYRTDALSILVLPRYAAYRMALEEQIRKQEPIESAPIIDGYQVIVSPSEFNAPDILSSSS